VIFRSPNIVRIVKFSRMGRRGMHAEVWWRNTLKRQLEIPRRE
jgi:hypothetical protein